MLRGQKHFFSPSRTQVELRYAFDSYSCLLCLHFVTPLLYCSFPAACSKQLRKYFKTDSMRMKKHLVTWSQRMTKILILLAHQCDVIYRWSNEMRARAVAKGHLTNEFNFKITFKNLPNFRIFTFIAPSHNNCALHHLEIQLLPTFSIPTFVDPQFQVSLHFRFH